MSMPSSGNLGELELKVSDLERVNFDLKMQLYYLSQKQVESNVLVPDKDEDEFVDKENLELMQLKEEQEYSRRRMAELESEILQLQIIREADIENAVKMKPLNMALIEENRKRERDAAMAIAEHDASVIRKLQADIASIQLQRESDKELVNTCAERLAQQLELVSSKDSIIAELSESMGELKNTVASLGDANRQKPMSRPDLRFMDENHYNFGNSPSLLSGSSGLGGNNNNESPISSSSTNGYDDITVAYYRSEVSKLKAENHVLKEQLARQQTSINNQEEALRITQSTADMSRLENDEITRLGAELDKCIGEKEQLQIKCQRLESASQTRNINSKPWQPQDDDRYVSLVGELQKLKQENETTIEMYRQREEELLLALEGVIQRCQELESHMCR